MSVAKYLQCNSKTDSWWPNHEGAQGECNKRCAGATWFHGATFQDWTLECNGGSIQMIQCTGLTTAPVQAGSHP